MRYNLPYLKYKNLIIKSRSVLAPMAGITDIPFRKMVRKWSKESLVFTEMLNSVIFTQAKKVEFIAQTTEEDQPIIYQFSGIDPYYFAKAAERAQKLGAFGVDINMACPTPKIVKKGEGAALLRTPELAEKILCEVVKSVDIPVSLKIRAGWDDNWIVVKEYSEMAEAAGLSAIAVHGRTRTQLYQGLANWDHIKTAQDSVNIPVIGSGDLWTSEDAKRMIDYTGCAGVWVARGALGNPWIVAQMDNYINTGKIEPFFEKHEKIEIMLEHIDLMVKFLGERSGVFESRKHIAWCIKNLPESETIRRKINSFLTYKEVYDTLREYQMYLFNMNTNQD